MEGPEERVLLESEGDMKGMIPRAVDQVFSSALQLREKGWEVRGQSVYLINKYMTCKSINFESECCTDTFCSHITSTYHNFVAVHFLHLYI